MVEDLIQTKSGRFSPVAGIQWVETSEGKAKR